MVNQYSPSSVAMNSPAHRSFTRGRIGASGHDALELAMKQNGRKSVVAVGENVRFDDDGVADCTFGGEPAGIDFRFYAFDNGSFPPIRKWVKFCGGPYRSAAFVRGRSNRNGFRSTANNCRCTWFAYSALQWWLEDTMRRGQRLKSVVVPCGRGGQEPPPALMLTPVSGAETRRLIGERRRQCARIPAGIGPRIL